ncbi:MAG: hypothetical protein RLZZ37_449, partial [Actinomycetota bacterium]
MTLIRLNANGTIDEDFGDDGAFIFSNAELAVEYTLTSSDIDSASITSIDIQSNGNIVAAAAFSFGSPTTYVTILMRINTNGTLDRTYGVNGFYEIMLESDTDANSWPKIITLDGFFQDWTIVAVTDKFGVLRVLRFSTTGTRYNYNVTSGILLSGISTIKESADSSIIILSYDDDSYFLIKLNSFGDLDENFGTLGISEIENAFFHVVDIQLSGSDRYFTIGYTPDDVPTIKKYKFDGTLDTTFGVSGVTTISLSDAALEAGVFDANSNLLVLGRIFEDDIPFISKIKPNGALDSSFGSSGTYTFSSGYRPYYIDIFNNLIYFSGDKVRENSFVTKFEYTLSTTGGGSSSTVVSTVVSPIVTKTKKYAITGFRANSFDLNSSVRKNISSARKSMKGKNVLKINCTGFVGKTSSSQPTASLRLIANKRSERVCNALKPYYPSATIVRSFKIVKGGSANLRKTNVTFTFS